ncbi:MAG: lysophospholipid acyltransferase family protein [Planctomycetota bacterium]
MTDLEPTPPRPTFRKRVRKVARRFAIATARWIGPPFVWALHRTWRFEVRGAEHLAACDAGGGALLLLWHGRMLVGMTYHANRGYSVLVSHAKDGEIMHRLLRAVGYGTIRGSTSRGAPRALREMIRELREGRFVVVTPDGPRGPRHSITEGLAYMSKATGLPLLPIGLAADRAWQVSSWDAFAIPKPFARIAILYGEPIAIDRRADDAEMERFTIDVRERMLALEEEAQEAADRRDDGGGGT